MMHTMTLEAVVAMIKAGKIRDFAVVAIMDNGELAMDFGQPPEDPDKLIEHLKEMITWVGNKEAHARTAATLAAMNE